MAMANYTGGFTDGIIIRGIPLSVTHPGKVYWVSNATTALLPGHKGSRDSGPGTFDEPFATLDYAIGQCLADRGDIIFVKPGHIEDLSVASAITSDVAGVAVIGLGTGSLRPRFDWEAAAATWVVSAKNCSFYNLDFVASFLDVTIMFDVSGVDGLSFVKCVFRDEDTNLNAIDFIDLATGADNFLMHDCKMIGGDAQNDSFITGVAHDGFVITESYFAMNVAQAAVVGLIETSGNVTNATIRDNAFRSNVDGALFLDFNGTANSGVVANCYFSSIDVAGAVTAGFDLTGMHAFELYVSGDASDWAIVGGGTVYS